MTRLRLSLLEGFALTDGGTAVPLPMTTQRVLAFLALRRRPMLRPYVAGMLWPDASESMARASLRSALWRLHRQCCAAVEVSAQHLALGTAVSLDVDEVKAVTRRLLEPGREDPELPLEWAAFSAELLPGWYDDWVLVERESLRQQGLHALERLCGRLVAGGRHAEAIEVGLRAVAIEPLRESAQLALIRAHVAEGNRWEAVRQYNLYRVLVRDFLDIEPSPRIQAFISSLKEPTTFE